MDSNKKLFTVVKIAFIALIGTGMLWAITDNSNDPIVQAFNGVIRVLFFAIPLYVYVFLRTIKNDEGGSPRAHTESNDE